MSTTIKKSLQNKSREYSISVRSRHPSHFILKQGLPKLPFKCIVRLGSQTVVSDAISLGGDTVEINEIDAVKNSSDKLLMKQCFTEAGVKTAQWFYFGEGDLLITGEDNSKSILSTELSYPIVIKHRLGSRGTGNYLIHTQEQFESFITSHKDRLKEYIGEKFHSFNKEYRLHITAEGCFYTCRKMLKEGATERWHRHDSNSVWIVEDNPLFDKPVNWDLIVGDCVKALDSLGLQIGAFDVKVQTTKDKKGNMRENPDYIVIESSSAPSFGSITAEKYIEEIPKVANRLAKQFGILKEVN